MPEGAMKPSPHSRRSGPVQTIQTGHFTHFTSFQLNFISRMSAHFVLFFSCIRKRYAYFHWIGAVLMTKWMVCTLRVLWEENPVMFQWQWTHTDKFIKAERVQGTNLQTWSDRKNVSFLLFHIKPDISQGSTIGLTFIEWVGCPSLFSHQW